MNYQSLHNKESENILNSSIKQPIKTYIKVADDCILMKNHKGIIISFIMSDFNQGFRIESESSALYKIIFFVGQCLVVFFETKSANDMCAFICVFIYTYYLREKMRL